MKADNQQQALPNGQEGNSFNNQEKDLEAVDNQDEFKSLHEQPDFFDAVSNNQLKSFKDSKSRISQLPQQQQNQEQLTPKKQQMDYLKEEPKLQLRISSSAATSQIRSDYGGSQQPNDSQISPTRSKQEGWRSVQGQVSFDHVLSDIGIGPFQYMIYGVMAILGLTEGAQVSVFTIMIPLLKKQWDVGDDTNSLQVCLVFLGFLVGSMVSGQFADRYGRRKPFIYSSFFTVFLTLAQAAAPNIAIIIILRFCCAILVGFFGPLGVTLVAEITPLAVRGRFMSLLTVSFSIGQLYGQFVGYFTLNGLNSGDWRAMIVWTGLPGAIAWIVAIIYLEESARFDIIDGRYSEGFKIIAKMNKMNGNRLEMRDLDEEIKGHLINWSKQLNKSLHQKKGSLAVLFQGDGRLLTPLIWFNWFTLSFIYYGILVLMPKMMDQLDQTRMHHQNVDDTNEIAKLALSTFFEMIAAAIASFLIEVKGLGRKNSLIICFVLQSAAALMVFADKGDSFVLWATVCKFFLTMTFIFSYQFTAEVYSTKIRTTGVGMANGIGRSGGAIVPWASQYLQSLDFFGPFLLFSSLSLLTALVDFIIPYDTLGRELDIAEEDDEHQTITGQKQELQSFVKDR